MRYSAFAKLLAAAGIVLASPVAAQIRTIDPDQSGVYAAQPGPEAVSQPQAPQGEPVDPGSQDPFTPIGDEAPAPQPVAPRTENVASAETPNRGDTIPREDVFTAAEGVFGKGAEGLAGIIEDILRDQGEPTAYISGQEAGGAFVVGVRYGSGTLHHKIEGDRLVYWTGPSVGFDFGADASKVFILVYNLDDSQDIYKRFLGAEGNAYVVGGFTASYLRYGNVVLIPVRLGVGARLGINAGYMHFTEKNRWLPF